MCEYVKLNKCTINNEICPFVYWCDKFKIWRANYYMPKNCQIKQYVKHEIPEGKYEVMYSRKGYLYVQIEDCNYRIKNPYDFVPIYIDKDKLKKENGQYIIEK